VIRSTGHDLLGRSNAPNSLSINTHHLKTLTVHDSFIPRECGPSNKHPAVTLGAGSQMTGVYTALAKHNLTIVGGTGETVSLGGYVSGGGYGVLTPWLGLAADQVLEVEVVLPNGLVVVGNACQNQDLLWAARGVSNCFILSSVSCAKIC
jgi:FAD/FMN-containing dehydrogenase